MAKRKNRIAPLEHEMRQLGNLKTLEPIATQPAYKPLSDQLVEIAIAALQEAAYLEAGNDADILRLARLSELVSALPDLAQAEKE